MATYTLRGGFADSNQDGFHTGSLLRLSRNSQKILMCGFSQRKPFLRQLLVYCLTHRIMPTLLGTQFARNRGYGLQILGSQRGVDAMNSPHEIVHFRHQMRMLNCIDLNNFSLGDSIVSSRGLSLCGRNHPNQTDRECHEKI